MPKKPVVYYDPLGADPESRGVNYVIIEKGPLFYVCATLYVSKRLDLVIEPDRLLLPIEEARRRFRFESMPIPEICPAVLRELETKLEEKMSKPLRNIGRRTKVA